MGNKDNLRENLALKIRMERTRKNISQEKLASIAGISIQTIGSIERKENFPTIETLADIADALEMKLCDLLNFD